jgi:hypothetical protein
LQIQETWQKAGLPIIRHWNEKRLKTLKARESDSFFMSCWQEGVQKISVSSFCTGKNDRGWRADIDWFLREGKLTEIIEGKFDDRSKPQHSFL